MKHILKNESGAALIITLSLLMILSLIGITSIETAHTDVELSFNQQQAEKAFFIAEAGSNRAYVKLNNNNDWDTGFVNIQINDGTYDVAVRNFLDDPSLDDTVIITSSGTFREALSIIELTAVPEYSSQFKFGMFGKDSIHIKNGMYVDSYNSDSGSYAATADTLHGDVGSNGFIDIKNGASIGGNVVTSLVGGASVNPGATVTGEIVDDIPEQIPPDIPQSEFDWAEANNDAGTGFSGSSYTYNPSTNSLIAKGNLELSEGVYFFSSIILKNSASLTVTPGDEVTIYVTGDIELKNSAEVNPGGTPSDLMIYSQGDFVLKNSGDFYGTFYNPNGVADLRNSGSFYGAVVAGYTIAHNSSNFHYDRNLGTLDGDPTGKMAIVGWREL
ncbi:MAG: hypothetical protein DRP35_06105 [Candidatus Zixiibacteriota bacterium]|nr:MAG: hypothetical protein DRP35_06105 [candidate division Zixibacteria bacterium]